MVERRRNTWIRNTRIQGKGPLLFAARVGIKSVRTLRVAKVYWLFEAIKPPEQFDSRNTRDCRVYFPSFAKRTRVNTTFETIKDHRFRMTLQMNCRYLWREVSENCFTLFATSSWSVCDVFRECSRNRYRTYYSLLRNEYQTVAFIISGTRSYGYNLLKIICNMWYVTCFWNIIIKFIIYFVIRNKFLQIS